MNTRRLFLATVVSARSVRRAWPCLRWLDATSMLVKERQGTRLSMLQRVESKRRRLTLVCPKISQLTLLAPH